MFVCYYTPVQKTRKFDRKTLHKIVFVTTFLDDANIFNADDIW